MQREQYYLISSQWCALEHLWARSLSLFVYERSSKAYVSSDPESSLFNLNTICTQCSRSIDQKYYSFWSSCSSGHHCLALLAIFIRYCTVFFVFVFFHFLAHIRLRAAMLLFNYRDSPLENMWPKRNKEDFNKFRREERRFTIFDFRIWTEFYNQKSFSTYSGGRNGNGMPLPPPVALSLYHNLVFTFTQ